MSNQSTTNIIDQIINAAESCEFSLFGGAIRDKYAGDVPEDLDFLVPRRDGITGDRFELDYKLQLMMEKLNKNGRNFELIRLADKAKEYPVNSGEIYCYTLKLSDFEVKLDFVPIDLFYRDLDVDVNGLSNQYPHKSITNKSKVIENCRNRVFEIIPRNSRHGYRDDLLYNIVRDYRMDWIIDDLLYDIVRDYRIVKMLNKGWMLKGLPYDSNDDTIFSELVKRNVLTTPMDGYSLLQINSDEKCALCDKVLDDKYVYHFVCCKRQIHIFCARLFVGAHIKTITKSDFSLELSCPCCYHDPFGYKTSILP